TRLSSAHGTHRITDERPPSPPPHRDRRPWGSGLRSRRDRLPSRLSPSSGAPPEARSDHDVEADENRALLPCALSVVDDHSENPRREQETDGEQRRKDKGQSRR